MKRLTRDQLLALALFAALLLTTLAAALQQNRDIALPALASNSTAPQGSQALREWLAALGYVVHSEPSAIFEIPEGTTLALLLEPAEYVEDGEWRTLDEWVKGGGTLILAGSYWYAQSTAAHYELDFWYQGEITATAGAATPLLASPPPASFENLSARHVLQLNREDALPLILWNNQPVFATFALEEGRVIVGVTAHPFSNAGLKESGNPEVVLSLLAAAGAPGTVWFDEWHHGQRSDQVEIIGPMRWLRYTPGGRSLLFAAAAVFVALLLQGRVFGRPVPPARPTIRRSPLEHVTALANLSRRAGHRSDALRHYHLGIKRSLGRRYRLDPTLPDEAFVTQLARYNPNTDSEALSSLLARLRKKNVSETELVRLAEEASGLMKENL